jgi:P-type E1-E2 ATPase
MIELLIPGQPVTWKLQYLVLDLNGTLALDGILLEGVGQRIRELAHSLEIFILTADTFGTAARQFAGYPCKLHLLTPEDQIRQKEAFVTKLGAEHCVAIGNGMNDQGMLRAARLGICISGPEGASVEAIHSADIVIPEINSALDLLLHTKRLIATLRS